MGTPTNPHHPAAETFAGAVSGRRECLKKPAPALRPRELIPFGKLTAFFRKNLVATGA